mmetsp:Transcript_81427/g.128201  ORF Transcript_81427/g.128201 Transcript_81427/m.128201 type:complete len:252 (-) Transcript_81427:2046-2801(-)
MLVMGSESWHCYLTLSTSVSLSFSLSLCRPSSLVSSSSTAMLHFPLERQGGRVDRAHHAWQRSMSHPTRADQIQSCREPRHAHAFASLGSSLSPPLHLSSFSPSAFSLYFPCPLQPGDVLLLHRLFRAEGGRFHLYHAVLCHAFPCRVGLLLFYSFPRSSFSSARPSLLPSSPLLQRALPGAPLLFLLASPLSAEVRPLSSSFCPPPWVSGLLVSPTPTALFRTALDRSPRSRRPQQSPLSDHFPGSSGVR